MPVMLPDIPQAEAAIIEMTNRVRAREKLSSVTANQALAAAARAFAAYLAKTNTFSHTADGKEPAKRAGAAGYEHCQIAENLALSEDSRGFEARVLATQTMEGWLNSPGHRANLLAPGVTEIGVAVARVPAKNPKYVLVQLFGRPLSLATEFQISNATKDTVTYALAGKSESLSPGMGVTHTICVPKEIAFQKAGSKPLKEHFQARHGTVYTLRPKAGSVVVEVKTREVVR